MKKSLLFQTSFILIFVVFMMVGCKGKKGDPGPAGSVKISSSTYDAYVWTYISPAYVTSLTVPQLTESNIDSAAVMVYISANGLDGWNALPYTQYTNSSNYFMTFNTFVNTVQIKWIYNSTVSAGDNPNVYYGNTVRFKVVVIPPGARKANADIDMKDYKKVKARFGLKD